MNTEECDCTPTTCPECGQEFTNPNQLILHTLKHNHRIVVLTKINGEQP